jgi:hypothetical protein
MMTTGRGERFLEQHPDATAEQIQAFQQSGRAGRSGVSMYMTRYMQEHPEATAEDIKREAQNYTSQGSALTRFMSGPQGNTVRSLGVVVDHIAVMENLLNALDNGNIQKFNQIANQWAAQTGNPAPTNATSAAHIVGTEVVKAIGIAGGGTKEERDAAAQAFGNASSPAQIRGAVNDVVRPLMLGQVRGLRRQFETSTGRPAMSSIDCCRRKRRRGSTKAKVTALPANPATCERPRPVCPEYQARVTMTPYLRVLPSSDRTESHGSNHESC